MATELGIVALAYPAAIGAAVSYSMYGPNLVPLAVGAVIGYPAYTIAGRASTFLPPEVSPFGPEMLAGGIIGYNLYNGSIAYTIGGVVAGAALKMAMAVVLVKELGPKL